MKTARSVLAAALLILSSVAEAQTLPNAADHPATPDMPGEDVMPPVMDTQVYFHGILDQFEGRIGGGNNAFRWDGQAWIGTDYNRLAVRSEGFALGGRGVGDGQLEFLYERAVTTFLDLQAGVRTDQDSGAGRTWAALGMQGLAPLFFDYEVTGYLSDEGHAALRVVLSYDLLLTQRLILQPAAELNFYSKADPGRRVGAGLSDIDVGLRLRYELSRKFAPYVGVAYVGRVGQTARLAGEHGDTAAAIQFVFGIRSWF